MDKVDELRKKLKEDAASQRAEQHEPPTGGSNSPTISATSSDIEQYVGDIINQDGHSVQPVPRPGLGAISVIRAIGNTQRKSTDQSRSAAPSNFAERRANRRSGEDNGQDRSDGTNVSASSPSRKSRQVGNLETYDEIPERDFATTELDNETTSATTQREVETVAAKRGRGRPPKQRDTGPIQSSANTGTIYAPQKERKIPGWLAGATLSKQEAKELEEPLIAALTDEFALADKALWSYIGDPLEQPVWSDISEKEMASLTHIILKLGQKSPVVATAARTAIDGSDYIIAAGVLAPRFQKTASIIREARKAKNAQNTSQRGRVSRFRSGSN